MCFTIPGKIVKMEKGKAIVAYGKEEREAAVVDDSVKIGDYVIVQGKIILQTVPKEEAEQFYDLITQEPRLKK
jgi:hydrogenase maturation factor